MKKNERSFTWRKAWTIAPMVFPFVVGAASFSTGTDFEALSVGADVRGITDSGAKHASGKADLFWNSLDPEAEAHVLEETTGLTAIGEWAESVDQRTLQTQASVAKPLYRLAEGSTDGTLKTATGPSMESAVYFDSLVRLATCEGQIDLHLLDQGVKIAVWILAGEGTGPDRLFVTAGYATARETVARNYDCGSAVDYGIRADAWCRLTIRAFSDISDGEGVPGFAVFLNGQGANASVARCAVAKGEAGTFWDRRSAAACAWGDGLFPSIDQASQARQRIGGAAFAGSCVVDDLTFSSSAESRQFAVEPGATPPELGSRNRPWQVGSPEAASVTAYVEDGTLHVVGSGSLREFDNGNAPWASRAAEILRLEKDERVTNLGTSAVSSLTSLENVNGLALDEMAAVVRANAFVSSAEFVNIRRVDASRCAQLGVSVYTNGAMEAAASAGWRETEIKSAVIGEDGKRVILTVPAPSDREFFILKAR